MASSILSVAAIDKFQAPDSLSKISESSSTTSINVEWSAVTPGTSPGGDVLGYQLRVEDINNGTTWIAFDGYEFGQPLKHSYSVYGLTMGRDY